MRKWPLTPNQIVITQDRALDLYLMAHAQPVIEMAW